MRRAGRDISQVRALPAHDPSLANLPEEDGTTALIAASANGHAALVKRLEQGVDYSARANEGAWALDCAVEGATGTLLGR